MDLESWPKVLFSQLPFLLVYSSSVVVEELADLLVSKSATGNELKEATSDLPQEVSETPTCQTEGDDARVTSRIDLPNSDPVTKTPIIVSQPHVGPIDAIPPVNSGS